VRLTGVSRYAGLRRARDGVVGDLAGDARSRGASPGTEPGSSRVENSVVASQAWYSSVRRQGPWLNRQTSETVRPPAA